MACAFLPVPDHRASSKNCPKILTSSALLDEDPLVFIYPRARDSEAEEDRIVCTILLGQRSKMIQRDELAEADD